MSAVQSSPVTLKHVVAYFRNGLHPLDLDRTTCFEIELRQMCEAAAESGKLKYLEPFQALANKHWKAFMDSSILYKSTPMDEAWKMFVDRLQKL